MALFLKNEQATIAMGRRIGAACQADVSIYLDGDLGAGKTTLTRGLLQAFGYHGVVKSPTFTLVEVYELDAIRVVHFDLYRLGDPDELDYMGVRDYFAPGNVCIVEWPQRGAGYLPQPDLTLTLEVAQAGRLLHGEAHSEPGRQILNSITSA